MTKEECVALLYRYAEYKGIGIPNLAGCKEAMKMAADLLSQPSLPSDLDEAANNYGVDIRLGYPRVMDETDRYIYNAFKAGAEWMAGQGVSEEFDVEDGMLPCFDSRLLGLNTIACAPTVLQCKDDDVVIMQLRKK